MEAIGTAYCEEAHRRTINNIDLMVKSLINISICGTRIGFLVMRFILIAVPKKETTSRITQVIFLRKTPAQQNQKFGAIVFLLRREAGSVGFSWCLIRRVVPSLLPVIQNNRGMKEN